MVDDGCAQCQPAGAVPHGVALFAVLQLQDGLCQEPGGLPWLHPRYVRLLTLRAVLAPHNHILLLWPIQFGPSLPHILPPALLASPRGIVRSVASTLRVASHVRFYTVTVHGSAVLNGISRLGAIKHTGLHLESQEPRYYAQLPRALRLQGTVSAMGVDVLCSDHAWNGSERRNVRYCRRTQYVFFSA